MRALRRGRLRRRDQGDAEAEAENHAQHIRTPGPESHADANLRRALGNCVGHTA